VAAKRLNRGCAGLLLALAATGAAAQNLEPRSYQNAPVGLNFLVMGYQYAEGGIEGDAATPLKDGHLRMHGFPLGYARSLDIAGNSGKLALLLPYASLSGSGTVNGAAVSRNVAGLADPVLKLSMNFYGAPALSAAEFAAYRQDLIAGASLQVTAPLGQYDQSRALNLGANRWSVKPELGVSKAWDKWSLELAAGATWFTDNHEYLGASTLAQDPLYAVQVHLTRQFSRPIWGALSYTHYTGGATRVDGIPKNDLQQNGRAGATLSFALDRANTIKLYAFSGIYQRFGTDLKAAGIGWQHLWGATP